MEKITGAHSFPSHLIADDNAPTPKSKNTLAKDDFMKLLMTQLTNQDPLKPMDHEQFSAQLAQFSSLEQLTNIGKGIDGLRTGQGDESKLQALSMIGKTVKAPGNEVQMLEGQSVTLHHSFGPDVKPTQADVFDSNGKKVREIAITKNDGSDIKWDGKTSDGVQLPSGKYTYRLHGTGKNGETQDAGVELNGKVMGMVMDGQTPTLIIQTPSGQSRIELTKVTQVMLDDGSAPATVPATPLAKPIVVAKPAANSAVKVDMSAVAPQIAEEAESSETVPEQLSNRPSDAQIAQIMEKFKQ
jgi:flagellar basal-body rod modification protein FlgD